MGPRKCELLRLARKRNLETKARQINPTGKSLKTLSSPFRKNIPLNPSGKSMLWLRVSHPMRGAGRDRHERAVGCGGRESLRKTNASVADGEAVWSWRSDAGVKFLRSKLLGDDGGKRARSPGRARNKP